MIKSNYFSKGVNLEVVEHGACVKAGPCYASEQHRQPISAHNDTCRTHERSCEYGKGPSTMLADSFHYYYHTRLLPEARCVCRQAAVKAAKILPFDGLARSKQKPNQPWARCSVFIPPCRPSYRLQTMQKLNPYLHWTETRAHQQPLPGVSGHKGSSKQGP